MCMQTLELQYVDYSCHIIMHVYLIVFQYELTVLQYPVFVHLYLELITAGHSEYGMWPHP